MVKHHVNLDFYNSVFLTKLTASNEQKVFCMHFSLIRSCEEKHFLILRFDLDVTFDLIEESEHELKCAFLFLLID